MKYLVILLLFITGCNASKVEKDVWVNTNMRTLNTANISYDKRLVYIDIYTLRTSDSAFKLGNASYFFNLPDNIFSNAKIAWKNPKYSTGDYDMKVYFYDQYSKDRVAIQLLCNGQGAILTDSLNRDKLGEKIATIQMLKKSDVFNIKWDTINSAIVTPEFMSSNSKWVTKQINGEIK